jgi:hypothetical protein
MDPNYLAKMKELDEKLSKKELMFAKKPHGSANLDKYKKMA